MRGVYIMSLKNEHPRVLGLKVQSPASRVVTSRITSATFSSLIGLIYDAAYEPALWPEFLKAMAAAIDGQGTLLFQHNFDTRDGNMRGDVSPLNAVIGFDPAYLRSYEEHFSRLNVWSRNEVELRTGRAVTGSMLFPSRDLPKTEFYSDWLRPQQLFYLLGGVVIRDGPWSLHFSSTRSKRTGDFSSGQLELYQRLVPHLARAAHIQLRFSFLQDLSNSSLALLDSAPAAVVLLDSSMRLVHANAAAETELRREDPLKLGSSGELRLRGAPSSGLTLRTLVQAALAPVQAMQRRAVTVMQVARRNGERLTLHAFCLPRGSQKEQVVRSGAYKSTCALVIHGPHPHIQTLGPKLLQSLYGLTAAEVRVAIAIAEGETLNHYAQRRGISRNTAATQLKSVFQKSGLRRQSELVRWLLQRWCSLLPGASD